MATKEYRFQHSLGAAVALERVSAVMGEVQQKYGLAREDQGPGRFRLTRTGAEARVAVTDDAITVAVELGWVLEKTVRGTLEETLQRRIAPVLKA
jgi:putative polyhydroxyalkanoate system protein